MSRQLTFKEYPHGVEKETMTVAELISFLQKLNPNQAIFATWESVFAPIKMENFDQENDVFSESVYVIDVEQY